MIWRWSWQNLNGVRTRARIPAFTGRSGISWRPVQRPLRRMNYIKNWKSFKNSFRSCGRRPGYLPVHRLIWKIFERTGYYDYVSAMPAGKARQANLDMAGGKGLRL